jgi:hypothetical protein
MAFSAGAAFIASLTLPWGQRVNADGAGGGDGARDFYHQTTSLLASGDTAPNRAVTWLFTRQQRPDGHYYQDLACGRHPDQNNIQFDEPRSRSCWRGRSAAPAAPSIATKSRLS